MEMKEGNNELKAKISNEELMELPLRHFDGEIEVIDNTEQLEEAIAYLWKHPVLGFDTETRPSFKKGQTNQVALLQLSTSEKAFLFRINTIGLPDCITELLASEAIVKVGAAIHDDIKILKNVNHFNQKGFLELQEYVKDFGIENFSLKKLSGIVMGFRISKSQRLSNWEAVELTKPQQIYAATDAWISLEIFNKLQALSN